MSPVTYDLADYLVMFSPVIVFVLSYIMMCTEEEE